VYTTCKDFNSKTDGPYSDHWALKGLIRSMVFCEIIECGFSKPDVLTFKPKVLLLNGVM